MVDMQEAFEFALGVRTAACTGCGCTDLRACPGGCSWAKVDRRRRKGLCSRCAARAQALGRQKKKRRKA